MLKKFKYRLPPPREIFKSSQIKLAPDLKISLRGGNIPYRFFNKPGTPFDNI